MIQSTIFKFRIYYIQIFIFFYFSRAIQIKILLYQAGVFCYIFISLFFSNFTRALLSWKRTFGCMHIQPLNCTARSCACLQGMPSLSVCLHLDFLEKKFLFYNNKTSLIYTQISPYKMLMFSIFNMKAIFYSRNLQGRIPATEPYCWRD